MLGIVSLAIVSPHNALFIMLRLGLMLSKFPYVEDEECDIDRVRIVMMFWSLMLGTLSLYKGMEDSKM